MAQNTQDQHGRVKDGVDEHGGVRERAQHAYDSARERAHDAVEASRRRAHDAAGAIDANPIGVLVGGLAVGALAAAVIPRGAREKQLLAPVGKRVAATAAAALVAAKAAGREELNGLGLNRDAAKGQARSIVDGVIKAASAAGKAGVEAGRERARND